VWRSGTDPILTDEEQEEVEEEVDSGDEDGDEETLVDDDMSCIDDGAGDTAGVKKRKGTVRLVIRSRAFL
jgi:hypothetical protein